MDKQNTERFSNRVEDYVKYRPGYPKEIILFLQQDYGLSTTRLIADIGAGTGISTALFLESDYQVTAIEPNREMREKAIALLGRFPGFTAIDGTAESTHLEGESVDALIAGQAFHWFDVPKAKTEFKRILRDNGLVVLMWNERRTQSAFEREYDDLIIRHGIDYVQVDHRNIDEAHLNVFYAPNPYQLKIFPNKQDFDLNGLQGRLLSSSYMPARGEKGYEQMIADLKILFLKHQQNDRIRIHYDTKVYAGAIK